MIVWWACLSRVGSGALEGRIAVSGYAGSGAFNLDDYARPTIPIGTFPIPAFNTSVNIRIDVTSALRQLVNGGAEFAALRFDPVGPDGRGDHRRPYRVHRFGPTHCPWPADCGDGVVGQPRCAVENEGI
jgi:hypothetical protein